MDQCSTLTLYCTELFNLSRPLLDMVLLNNAVPKFSQVGENFHVFSPSQNLLGVSQHLQLLLWTMAPLPGASQQGELEDGETVATSPQDTMAGPLAPQCLHPASQVTPSLTCIVNCQF